MNLNKAFIIGRLTQDPDARTTPTGANVASFSVATNRYWTNPQGERQDATEYHNIVVWSKLADVASKYLKKGGLVMIEGRLQTRSWDGQDGVKRYRTEIVAESLQLGPRRDAGSSAPATADSKEESIPTIQQDEVSPAPAAPSTGEVNVEDIPF